MIIEEIPMAIIDTSLKISDIMPNANAIPKARAAGSVIIILNERNENAKVKTIRINAMAIVRMLSFLICPALLTEIYAAPNGVIFTF